MDSLEVYVKNQIADSIATKQKILGNESLLQQIKQAGLKCIEVYKNGNKTLIAGNGRIRNCFSRK